MKEGVVYRVRPWATGWGVFEKGEPQATEPFMTQADAVIHAKELARRTEGGAQILVYSEAGVLVSEFFYMRDEREALDEDDSVRSVAASRPVSRPRPKA
jgi:hypothetical protein